MSSLSKGKRAIKGPSLAAAEQDKAKHQKLLMEHLQLQKEVVSKKRKLKKQKEKRENLCHEIAFLRRRLGYLSKKQHADNAPEFQVQSSGEQGAVLAKEKNGVVSEAVEKYSSERVLLNCTMDGKERGEKDQQIFREPSQMVKNSKNGLIDENRMGKKKISSRDQMPDKF